MNHKQIFIAIRGIISPWILYVLVWLFKLLGFNVRAEQMHLVFLFCLYFMVGLIALGLIGVAIQLIHRRNGKP